MHLTLKKTTKPAASNFLQQQAKFDDFIDIFNNQHPHEAEGMKCPAEVSQPSTRLYLPCQPRLGRAAPGAFAFAMLKTLW